MCNLRRPAGLVPTCRSARSGCYRRVGGDTVANVGTGQTEERSGAQSDRGRPTGTVVRGHVTCVADRGAGAGGRAGHRFRLVGRKGPERPASGTGKHRDLAGAAECAQRDRRTGQARAREAQIGPQPVRPWAPTRYCRRRSPHSRTDRCRAHRRSGHLDREKRVGVDMHGRSPRARVVHENVAERIRTHAPGGRGAADRLQRPVVRIDRRSRLGPRHRRCDQVALDVDDDVLLGRGMREDLDPVGVRGPGSRRRGAPGRVVDAGGRRRGRAPPPDRLRDSRPWSRWSRSRWRPSPPRPSAPGRPVRPSRCPDRPGNRAGCRGPGWPSPARRFRPPSPSRPGCSPARRRSGARSRWSRGTGRWSRPSPPGS